jgi:hypothetical protein
MLTHQALGEAIMDYDESRVADATLALMFLGVFEDAPGLRTWKAFDWTGLKQLHELGYISDPVNKNKSVPWPDSSTNDQGKR